MRRAVILCVAVVFLLSSADLQARSKRSGSSVTPSKVLGYVFDGNFKKAGKAFKSLEKKIQMP